MAKEINPNTIKNQVRVAAFQKMVEIFTNAYGENVVYQIGDSEIAVKVNTAPTGEPIFAIYSPTIKDYCDRKTNTKTIKAFDVAAATEKYLTHCAEREKEKREKAELNKKKIERDKAAREKRKAERLKRKKGEH